MALPKHPFGPLIEEVCQAYPPLPIDYFTAMVMVESNFNPNAQSASDARGLTQILYRHHGPLVDETAKRFGVEPGADSLYDPRVSLYAGGRHLRWLYQDDDPGKRSWERAVRKYFTGTADPPSGFTDGQGTTPDQHITKLRAALTTVRTDIGDDHPTKEEPRMTKPHILLVAGHRSVGDGGNPTERALTDDLAVAYQKVFKAAGFPVEWVNPTMYAGGLNGLALGTARAMAAAIQAGHKLVIMLDLHFNGARSGVHVIPAHNRRRDGRGALSSGYPQGRVTDDVMENNTLDVKVGEAIAREIAKIDGMTLWGSNGVMPENQTGVGNDDGQAPDNARLAMMAATAPYRMKALRFTVEHGGTNDASKPDFANKCAQAAVRAITASLPVPVPDEDDPETPPKGDPGGPDLPSFLFGEADGLSLRPERTSEQAVVGDRREDRAVPPTGRCGARRPAPALCVRRRERDSRRRHEAGRTARQDRRIGGNDARSRNPDRSARLPGVPLSRNPRQGDRWRYLPGGR